MNTVFVTVLSGTLVYVLGQVLSKFWIEPIVELNRTRAKIKEELRFSQNLYCNPIVGSKSKDYSEEHLLRYREASKMIRRLASRLVGQQAIIPLYALSAKIFRLPSLQVIDEALSNLTYISNSFFVSSLEKGWIEEVHNAENVVNKSL